jgi:hypothetical protein
MNAAQLHHVFPSTATVGPVLLSQAHHGPGKQHAIHRGTALKEILINSSNASGGGNVLVVMGYGITRYLPDYSFLLRLRVVEDKEC